MLLVGIQNTLCDVLLQKYPDKVNIINPNDYKELTDGPEKYPINCLSQIKYSYNRFDLTYVLYNMEIVACLNALKLDYKFLFKENKTPTELEAEFKKQLDVLSNEKIIFDENNNIENILSTYFEWIKLEPIEEVVETGITNIEPTSKTSLTLEQLINDDVEITDTDVRDMKVIQNKLKVGMLLQAKSMLNRVLKLSTILDKLYDKLLDRIDDSLETTDTASLMYTAEYINKALSETNQFMMSLINNEKIQNFFIIDNSTVINTTTDDRLALDKRQKIRKAAEIVLDNLDYLVANDYNKIKDPNQPVEVIKEEGNVDTESESI